MCSALKRFEAYTARPITAHSKINLLIFDERCPSFIKVRVECENVVNRKIRVRACADTLNKLLVTVSGFRQYTALSDLRLSAFPHGLEICLPQVAIQETTSSRLEG